MKSSHVLAGLFAACAVVPPAGAQCSYPPLAHGVPLSASGESASIRFSPPSGTFAVLGLRSDAGSEHALTAYASTGPAPSCGSGALATSATPGGVEVVLGDYRGIL